MPRFYERKTNRYSWSESSLENAFDAVRHEKLGIRKAAAKFGIPYTTLQARITDNWRANKMKLGRKHIFNESQEIEIANLIIEMSTKITLTSMNVRRLVYEYAVKNKVVNTFNTTKKECGKEWLISFLKRYPNIKFGKHDNNKIKKCNRKTLDAFYDKIEGNKLEPQQIYNVATFEILREHNQYFLSLSTTSASNATSVFSVTIGVSAIGHYVPPMFTSKRSIRSDLNGPIGAIYQQSKSGLICEELFLDWFKHFAKFSKCTVDAPVVLIIDYQSISANAFAVKFCRDMGIELIPMPPHESHRLLPLQVSFFVPLQCSFQTELNSRQLQTVEIPDETLIECLKDAYYKAATLQNAIKGFHSSGVNPFNRFLILEAENTIEQNVGSSEDSEEIASPNGGRLATEYNTDLVETFFAENIKDCKIVKKEEEEEIGFEEVFLADS